MSLSMAMLLPLDEPDVVQLAPKLTRYEQPIATAVVSDTVQLVVIVRFVWINTNQVDLSLHSAGFGVDDDDDVFRVHIGINLTIDILQLVEAIQRSFMI